MNIIFTIDEIIFNFCYVCDIKLLLKLSQLNKQINKVTMDKRIYQHFLIRDYNYSRKISNYYSYYKSYKKLYLLHNANCTYTPNQNNIIKCINELTSNDNNKYNDFLTSLDNFIFDWNSCSILILYTNNPFWGLTLSTSFIFSRLYEYKKFTNTSVKIKTKKKCIQWLNNPDYNTLNKFYKCLEYLYDNSNNGNENLKFIIYCNRLPVVPKPLINKTKVVNWCDNYLFHTVTNNSIYWKSDELYSLLVDYEQKY